MPSDDKPSWQTLESLLAKLKPAQRALAQSFVEQARRSEAGRVPLAELLQSHFGEKASNRVLAGLRQTRKRLNEELAALGAGIELVVDEGGKLESRTCYLQAPVGKGAELEELADALNYDRDRGKHVPPKARPLNEPATIEIPISYSHKDKSGESEKKDFIHQVADEAGVDLIPALIAWAKEKTAPPFCALFGEYGIGKTVSCQMLADQMNTERKKPESGALPLALYFDLRRVDSKRLSDFAVEPIIEQLLKSADQHKLKARELIDWVRANPALVIFDGLDKVLVHLSPKQGHDFTRALWSIYPPSHWQRRAEDQASTSTTRPNTASKLLMSCRSHYFRTIAEERALYIGQDRESIRASDYRAYLILPFNDEQIFDYLKRSFPQRDPAQTLEFIAAVYNLKELAQRPVLLRHIGDELAELEQRKIAGQAINTAVLYGLFVERWLHRDDAKHQLSLPHKQVLMEHLAAELTRRGVRELAYDRVEDWLDRFIAARPEWESVYRGTNREILKEDLRTATFIVRPDEKKFRFAHTSLQEYFLAGYLLHGLMAGEADSCRLPLSSPETFNFFAERWQVADADHDDRLPDAQRTLAALLEQAAPGRSETAFGAWLALHDLGLSPLRPARFDLHGCDLSGWTVDGGEIWLPRTGQSGKKVGMPHVQKRAGGFCGPLRRPRIRDVPMPRSWRRAADAQPHRKWGVKRMTLIFRADLQCPIGGCKAAIVEEKLDRTPPTYHCKAHGKLLPPVKPLPHTDRPRQGCSQ